jgi:asparagine synthase (glutamine-hydrolysing)
MPGIFGLISRQQPEKCHRQLKSMVAAMQYEKFYNSGIYNSSEFCVYIGWSVHIGSFSDCMPATNYGKDIILFFAGEVFNDSSDSSVGVDGGRRNPEDLVALYERWGERFLDKLNGLFSGLILDARQKKILLFNDRYGMNRVFIHESKEGFYFSSEAKALLAALPETREFDSVALGEFLTCGSTLGRQSLYKGITILPGGSLWTGENGAIKSRGYYFDLEKWTGQKILNEKECAVQVVDLFGRVVQKYVQDPVPVGISLTGGLDSRMIMACLDGGSNSFPCYTFGSMYRDTFDVQTAREISKTCGQTHQVLVLGEDFLHSFMGYLEKAVYISDGYLGMSGAAELYLNSLARDISPVRLTGNYGGELLRGHRAFKPELPRINIISPELDPFLRKAQTKFRELEVFDSITFALFHQASSQGYGRFAIERSQVHPRTPFMDNDLVGLLYQVPHNLLVGSGLSMAIVSRYNPKLLTIPTDRGLLQGKVTIRSLARQFQHKALIKAEYLTSHGMPNWLAGISRCGIGRFLEKQFLGRDKFQHFRFWTKRRFASYLSETLVQRNGDLEQFLNLRQMERILYEHVAGNKNYIYEIDRILTLSLGCKTLLNIGSSTGLHWNNSIDCDHGMLIAKKISTDWVPTIK